MYVTNKTIISFFHSFFFSRHSPLQDGVGVRRDRRESAGREPSCPPIEGDIRRQRWLSQARRRVA